MVIKNMPAGLVPVALPEFARGHSRPADFEGWRSWSTWRSGWKSALLHAPDAVRKRGAVQVSRRVTDAHVRSILKSGAPEACHL
jgi:hypothetical protein